MARTLRLSTSLQPDLAPLAADFDIVFELELKAWIRNDNIMFEVNWSMNPYYPMAQVHFSKRDIIGTTGLAAVGGVSEFSERSQNNEKTPRTNLLSLL